MIFVIDLCIMDEKSARRERILIANAAALKIFVRVIQKSCCKMLLKHIREKMIVFENQQTSSRKRRITSICDSFLHPWSESRAIFSAQSVIGIMMMWMRIIHRFCLRMPIPVGGRENTEIFFRKIMREFI